MKRKDKILLFVLVTLAIIARILFLKDRMFMDVDTIAYAILGENLLSGYGYTYNGNVDTVFPPFYPLMIGLIWKIIGDLELSCFVVTILAGSFMVIPVFLLANQMYGRRVAILSSIITIIYWPLLVSSTRPLSEGLFCFLIAIAMYLGYRLTEDSGLRHIIALGLVLGCAYLTRPEGFLFFLYILVFLSFSKIRLWHQIGKEDFIKIVTFIAIFSIFLFSYMSFLHKHTGKWQLSGKFDVNLVRGDLDEKISNDPLSYEKNSYLLGNTSGYLKQMPLRHHLKRYIKNIRFQYWALSCLVESWMLAFIFIGLFAKPWDGQRKQKELYLLGLWSPLLVITLFWVLTRFLMPFLPTIVIWTASGIVRLTDWSSETFHHRSSRKIVVAVIIAASMLLFLKQSFKEYIVSKNEIPYEHKEMGIWLKANIDGIEHKVIMSRRPFVSFYSGGKWTILPYEKNSLDLINFLKKGPIEYLIIDERTVPLLRPNLIPLLDEKVLHDGLEVKHVICHPKKIICYQVKK
jgi:4-amino-4-deoxy-L-arabinose transferase-like glycosyltransferase